MKHLKKNIVVDSTVRATGWVAKQGLSAGLKLIGVATGPAGWVLSFLGKRVIDKIIMPYSEALGIKAKRSYQARLEKKEWKKQVKNNEISTKEYMALRKKRAEKNKEYYQKNDI